MFDKPLTIDATPEPGSTQAGRIHFELAQRGQTTVRSLADATEIAPSYVSVVVSRLVGRGDAVRLGRGLIAVAVDHRPFSKPEGVHLGPAARRLIMAVSEAQISAALSGYDVIGAYANQLATGWAHLLYVERGSGEWAADVLREAGMRPVLNPSTEQMELLGDLAIDGIVILRERSVGRLGKTGLRSREEAWVDLAVEQRHGYPVTVGELRDILGAMAGDGISFTSLVRQARRRSLALRLDPARRIPLIGEDQATSALIPA